MKTLLIVALSVFSFLILFVGGCLYFMSSVKTDTILRGAAMEDSIAVRDLELRDGMLHGVVRNEASRTWLEKVTIGFDFYDADHIRVGTGRAEVFDLDPGEAARFSVRARGDLAVSFKQDYMIVDVLPSILE